MPKFLVKKAFKGAIRGIHVRDYAVGERVAIDCPDLARVALANGWIESDAGLPDAPKNKALKKAPKAKGAETE